MKIWDKIAKIYAKKRFFGKGLFKEEKFLLPKFLENCKFILDAGCGTGRHLNFLKKFGKVVGIDYSKQMIKYALKKSKNLILADLRALPFKTKVFDCVVCLGNTLGSLENDYEKVVQELNRVARKKVIIEVRVAEKDLIYRRKFENFSYRVKVWTIKTFENFLKKMGLNEFELIEGHKFKDSRFVYAIFKPKILRSKFKI
jgi:ubiquinone/menaquinone biosynthesis C-methylase UbiE